MMKEFIFLLILIALGLVCADEGESYFGPYLNASLPYPSINTAVIYNGSVDAIREVLTNVTDIPIENESKSFVKCSTESNLVSNLTVATTATTTTKPLEVKFNCSREIEKTNELLIINIEMLANGSEELRPLLRVLPLWKMENESLGREISQKVSTIIRQVHHKILLLKIQCMFNAFYREKNQAHINNIFTNILISIVDAVSALRDLAVERTKLSRPLRTYKENHNTEKQHGTFYVDNEQSLQNNVKTQNNQPDISNHQGKLLMADLLDKEKRELSFHNDLSLLLNDSNTSVDRNEQQGDLNSIIGEQADTTFIPIPNSQSPRRELNDSRFYMMVSQNAKECGNTLCKTQEHVTVINKKEIVNTFDSEKEEESSISSIDELGSSTKEVTDEHEYRETTDNLPTLKRAYKRKRELSYLNVSNTSIDRDTNLESISEEEHKWLSNTTPLHISNSQLFKTDLNRSRNDPIPTQNTEESNITLWEPQEHVTQIIKKDIVVTSESKIMSKEEEPRSSSTSSTVDVTDYEYRENAELDPELDKIWNEAVKHPDVLGDNYKNGAGYVASVSLPSFISLLLMSLLGNACLRTSGCF